MTPPHPFQNRISYQGDISIVLRHITEQYSLGSYKSHAVIGIGYEDFNLKLITNEGVFFVKFFADFRNDQDCQRYVDIMDTVVRAGVSHPKLISSSSGFLSKITQDESTVRCVVTEFIEGDTFYDLGKKPTEQEKDYIIHQATLINQIKMHPEFVYDSWAVINFLNEYTLIKGKLSSSDISLIEPLINEFSLVNLSELPHCFVHGDIIDTNVLKGRNNSIYILDFSVANYYPRIQELAVLLCDILFDIREKEKFGDVYNRTLEIYQQQVKLIDSELQLLPLFIQTAHSMHIIGASKNSIENGNSSENQYWLKAGREGLQFTSKLWSKN